MRTWACLLVSGTLIAACAGGDNPGGDSFTFGGPGGNDSMTGPSTATMGGGPGGDTDGGTNGGTGPVDPDDTGSVDGVNCIDGDGDEYGDGCAAGEDCDDTNPDINPGMGETCDGVDENCDGEIDNGCDCPEDGVSGACNSPTDLGVIDVGGSTLGVVGTIPQEGSLDWYTVSFPAPMRPGEGVPTISFAINSGDAFAFDVVNNECDVDGTACTDAGGMGGAGVGLTSWTFRDDDPGCCSPPMDSMVPWPNQVYIRVYRTSMGASCDTYQLQASR